MTFESATYSNPAYLAYNVIGWNSYYGTLYTELSEIFQEPYATTLPPLFDGTNDAATINNACPTTLEELMQPGLVDEILADITHPFMVAAQDNDVYQWIPEVPVEMYYCTQDEQVFYQNALTADTWMTENGGSMRTATNSAPTTTGNAPDWPFLVDPLDPIKWRNVPPMSMNMTLQISGCFQILQPTSSHVKMDAHDVVDVRSLTSTVIKQGVGSRLEVRVPAGMWLVVANGFGPQALLIAQ